MPRLGTSLADFAAPARGLLLFGVCCLLVTTTVAQDASTESVQSDVNVLPSVEPMPRPTRLRFFLLPSAGLIVFSFIFVLSCRFAEVA